MNLKHSNLIKTILFCLLVPLLMAYREPQYCKMVDQITKSYLKEYVKPRRMMQTEYGGEMMDDIQKIFLSFVSFETLNVDQARILYVEMMEEYLKRVNNHEKVRPHLHNFPFEESNIKLMLSFENPDLTIKGDGNVALMSIAKNSTIYFAAFNPTTEKFYTIHEETYSEALKLMKEGASSVSNKVENEALTANLKKESQLQDNLSAPPAPCPKELQPYAKEILKNGYDFQKTHFL